MGSHRRVPARQAGLIALVLALLAAGCGDGRALKDLPPSDSCPARTPLLVHLHGYSENAEEHAAFVGLPAHAEEHGFVVVTPQADGDPPHWDLDADVDRIEEIIDGAIEDHCVDGSRVYVSGYSMGGMLISHLVCRLAHKVAAVAPVGGMRPVEPCAPSRPVPVLVVHGTEDDTVLFDGGLNPAAARALNLPLQSPSIPDLTTRWAARNGCDPEPVVDPGPRITVHRYPCPADAEVELHVIQQGSHSWPTSATATIWSFFERHARG